MTPGRLVRRSGFTLVELVVVIAVTGVLAATLVVFFTPAVNSYFDARRRAGLTDAADTALRRIARDTRSAVPNSIRLPHPHCFEMLPTSAGGRYRMAPDTLIAGSEALDTSQPSTGFDVLTPLSTAPAAGDWVVIGNHNTNDVYENRNRAQITGVSPPADAAHGTLRINFASTQFPAGYEGGRFSVVPGNGGKPAVFYVCQNPGLTGGSGTGTLLRLTRDFVPGYPAACPATAGAAVVATHVSNCSFVYTSASSSTQQNGFVSMLLELTRDGETVALSFGTHVDNVP